MNIDRYLPILRDLNELNESYPAIKKTESTEALCHTFWDLDEILSSLELRNDWSIAYTLIPFYGDWHDLYCFDTNTGSIIELNDERSEIYRWKTMSDFRDSLIHSSDWEDPVTETKDIIESESHLDF
jgi:hypothetical protein